MDVVLFDVVLFLTIAMVFAIVFFRLSQLQHMVNRLTAELAELRKTREQQPAPAIQTPLPASPVPAAPATWPTTPTQVLRQPLSATTIPPQVFLPPAAVTPPLSSAPVPPPTVEHARDTARAKREERLSWEMLVGGNIFNYIGAIALFFGLAFLLKYAIDHNWITPLMRVLLGYAIGIGLLFAGHYFHQKGLQAFAYGVIGTGVAVCYLCGFAAYKPAIVGSPLASPMVSYPIAFLLMTAAAVLAFQQALAYNSQPVALLGWAGGLLTPFILQSSDAHLIGLYFYLLLFTASMVALTVCNTRWISLLPLTLGAVYLIYLIFYFEPNTVALSPRGNVPASTIFLLGIAALVQVGEYCRTLLSRDNTYTQCGEDGYRTLTLFNGDVQAVVWQRVSLLNGLVLYGCLWLTLHELYQHWLPLALLISALLYLGTSLTCERRKVDYNGFIARSLLMVVLMTALAAWQQWDGFPRVMAFTLGATASFVLGTLGKRRYLTEGGLALLAVSTLVLFSLPNFYAWQQIESFIPLFNSRVLAVGLAIAGMLGAIRLLRQDPQSAEVKTGMLQFGWSLLAVLLLACEVNDTIRHLVVAYRHSAAGDWAGATHYFIVGLALLIAAVPLMQFGIARNSKPVLLVGFGANLVGIILVAVRLFVFGDEYSHFVKIVTATVIFLPMLGVLLLAPRMIQREHPERFTLLPTFQYLAAYFLGTLLVGFDCRQGISWLLEARLLPFAPDNPNIQLLALGVGLALYTIAVHTLALRAPYAVLLAPAAVTGIAGWLLVVAGGMDYPVQAGFLPLFNYRAVAMLAVIVALLGLGRLAHTGDARERWLATYRQALPVLAAIAGFLLIGEDITGYTSALKLAHVSTLLSSTPDIACGLLLGFCWSAYGVALASIARQRHWQALFVTALLAFAIGVLTTVGVSFFYQPAGRFILLNLHTPVLLGVSGTMLLMERLLKRYIKEHADMAVLREILHVAVVVMLYLAVAEGAWLAYSNGMDHLNEQALANAENVRQVALSVACFLFAICALGTGFLRKLATVRITAIVLFLAVIAKVFLYDLSLLDTGNRIISFIGLGVLLLAASYLYHRYRHLLAQFTEHGS